MEAFRVLGDPRGGFPHEAVGVGGTLWRGEVSGA